MRCGFLSSYPPTLCGLATFTAALGGALKEAAGCSIRVVRALDAPERRVLPDVAGEVWAGDALSRRRAAEVLNGCDVAIVQHEYGIYGGPDGIEVLDVLRRLRVPTIVVLHTVLTRPSAQQKKVIEAVMEQTDVVVTMSHAARDRLLAGYDVSPRRVVVIPHGAAPAPVAPSAATPPTRASASSPATGPRILTWGLIGPGKGIEWAVEAMAALSDLDPQPHYLIASETHPKVVAREGERYRDGLRQRARDLGIDGMIHFDQMYRPTSEIPHLIASADIVLLPYDSTEQVTSGVLIEAVAAGRPVVSTCFPHAVELLADGVGVTVPHRDPDAIAAALRRLLTMPAEAERMRASAMRSATSLLWPTVAGRYLSLAQGLIAGRLAVAGLEEDAL